MRRLSSKFAGQQSGFTLIELVIVIVIIGILAAVAIPNFADTTADAKLSVAKDMGAQLKTWAGSNAARCSGKLAGAVASAGCNAAGMTGAGAAGAAVGDATSCVVTPTGGVASPAVVGVVMSASSCT